MNATYDYKKDEWIVQITYEDLKNAFKSYSNYYNFLKKIMANTYGDEVAQLCYPDDVTDIEE